jgi:hypothetical protein
MAQFSLAERSEAANTKLREGINAKLQYEISSLSHGVDGFKKRESEKILIISTRLCREFI